MNVSIKFLILGLVLVTLVSTQDFNKRILEQESEEDITSFNDFIKKFNRVFETDSEFYERFHIFKKNKKIVEELKLSDPESTMGINKFSDLTEEEFEAKYSNKNLMDHIEQTRKSNNVKREPIKPTKKLQSDLQTPQSFITQIWNYFFPQKIDLGNSLPNSFDWKDQGIINPVLDQGNCGSCWSFVTTSTIEAQVAKQHNGKKVRLSEQYLLDCDGGLGQNGCQGGNMVQGYRMAQFGMQTEESYKYISGDYPFEKFACLPTYMGGSKDMSKIVVRVTDFSQYPQGLDEDMMKLALHTQGPLAAAMSFRPFRYYKSGVYKPSWGECTDPVDHGVMVVGYGVDNDGTKYWNIKNTHGSDWGEKGYFRIQRGIGACSINIGVSVPDQIQLVNNY